MQTRLYTPEPALKRPGVFFADLWSDICSSRELAIRLAMRDFKAMYRQSLLGYVWAFIPPLVTTALFLVLRGGGAFSADDPRIPYLPFVLMGTLMWQIFADALQGPLKVVGSGRAMLVKINFPREALILAGFGMTVINFVIRLVILVPALIFFFYRYPDQIQLTWAILFFPVGVFSLMLLGYTVGILMVPLGMLYTDVIKSVALFTTFWMFITPVVFPLAQTGIMSTLQILNPVTPILVTTRELLFGLSLSMPGHFGLVMMATVGFLLLGWVLYRIALPHIIARLGM